MHPHLGTTLQQAYLNAQVAVRAGDLESLRAELPALKGDLSDLGRERLHDLVFAAISFSKTHMLLPLIEAGADVNSAVPQDWPDEVYGQTPLIVAAEHGDTETARRLIGLGADIGAVDSEGRSALDVALRLNHVACATTLLEAGADPNAPGPSGMTPLQAAAHRAKPAQVALLLDHGADPNLVPPSHHGYSPLLLALASDCEASARRLVQGGADVNARTPTGSTVPHMAHLAGLPALAQEFWAQASPETHYQTLVNAADREDTAQVKRLAPKVSGGNGGALGSAIPDRGLRYEAIPGERLAELAEPLLLNGALTQEFILRLQSHQNSSSHPALQEQLSAHGAHTP